MPEPPRTDPAAEDDQRWSALLIATLSSFLTPFMLSVGQHRPARRSAATSRPTPSC